MADNKTRALNLDKAGFFKLFRNYSFVGSFVLVLILGAIFVNDFFAINNITTLMLQATIKGIMAVGLTFVITCNMFDLSAGAQLGLTAALGVTVYNLTGNFLLMLLFCICFAGLLSSANGLLVTYGKMPTFIATLATSTAYRSIASQFGAKKAVNVISPLLDPMQALVNGKIFGTINYFMLIFIIITLFGVVLLNKTKFGKHVTAVGSNQNAARLAGINVTKIKILCYIVSGVCIGISAFLFSARLTSITCATAGVGYETDAIAALAIGGTKSGGGRGRVVGTVIGAVILVIIDQIVVAAKIPAFLADLVVGIVIIVAVLTQTLTAKRD